MSTLSCSELEKDILRYHVGTPNQVILSAYGGADASFSGYTNPDLSRLSIPLQQVRVMDLKKSADIS